MTVSMTGYGRNVVEYGTEQIIMEIRTVNHRYLDISVHMPRELLYLETSVKDAMKDYVERGSVDIYIHYDYSKTAHKVLKTDWQLMDQYVEQMNRAKSRYHLNEGINLSDVMHLPDVFIIEEKPLEAEKWETSILYGIRDTAKLVLDMRQSEGINLQAIILQQIESIKEAAALLSENRDSFIYDYTKRIQHRIWKMVDDPSIIDEGRLQQEIAVLAEKGDITEELTRIDSHIVHFMETINSPGQIGRTLEFITQEIQREVNTIASKSQDAKMNQQIILMKRNIEKIKEQIQNIE